MSSRVQEGQYSNDRIQRGYAHHPTKRDRPVKPHISSQRHTKKPAPTLTLLREE